MTVDIVLAVNTTSSTRKVPSHMRLERLAHNEKGSLSGLLGVKTTSSMILSAMKEAILMTTRKLDSVIIDVTRNQKWQQMRNHTIDLQRYGSKTRGMELLKVKI